MIKVYEFIKKGKEIMNTYSFILLGIVFLILGLIQFKYDMDLVESVKSSIKYNDVNISLPSSIKLEFRAGEDDRKLAWEIFVQIRTRIAGSEFKVGEDSFIDTNKSLHDLFNCIREKIEKLPLKTIRKDNDGNTVEFYLSILNDGIRPFLTKWHVPVTHFHSLEENKGLSPIEIDRKFANHNPTIFEDIKILNAKMKKYSLTLHKIAKGNKVEEDFTEAIKQGQTSPTKDLKNANEEGQASATKSLTDQSNHETH